MGIRIHTVLGYGWEKFDLSLLPEDKDFLPEMLSEAKKEEDGKGFICRIENKGWYERDSKIKSLGLYDFVKYNNFEDKFSPLIITSPFNSDWNRYDDIIDYYQSNGQKDEVKLLKTDQGLPKPIYPFDGFINKNTKERVKMSYHDTWGGEESFTQKTGLKFSDLAAIVPYEIELFCRVSKFPLDIYSAHPMIYTYWC